MELEVNIPSSGKMELSDNELDMEIDDLMEIDSNPMDRKNTILCLSSHEALEYVQSQIRELKNVATSHSESAILTALAYQKWDQTEAIVAIFDSSVHTEHQMEENPECLICMEEAENKITLDCGHSFCEKCWEADLNTSISENKKPITCPGIHKGKKCTMILYGSQFQSLLRDKQREKFSMAILDTFIHTNPSCYLCLNCNRVIIARTKSKSIQCECGFAFCGICKKEDHQPATCDMMRKWEDLVPVEENQDLFFIKAYTKECPQCLVNVEKAGGCLHLHCTNCGFHFCWKCGGKFGSGPLGGNDGYRTHVCQEKEEKKETDLHEPNHHLEKWNHASILKQKILFEFQKLQKNAFSAKSDMNHFIEEVIPRVSWTCQVMRCAKVWSYFTPKSFSERIFQYLEEQTEVFLEKMLRMIQDANSKEGSSFPHDILNIASVCQNLAKKISREGKRMTTN